MQVYSFGIKKQIQKKYDIEQVKFNLQFFCKTLND